MSGTPRLRSSYPSTPGSVRQTPAARGTPPSNKPGRSPLPDLPDAANAPPPTHMPVIPVTLIDAPSQRMYALAIYGLLLVWRLYDWWTLVEEETSSFALFFKWAFIDSAYTFGVPLLRIPWLEWSETTSAILALAHTLINGMLMFRIPVRYPPINTSMTYIDHHCSYHLRVVSSSLLESSLTKSWQLVRAR